MRTINGTTYTKEQLEIVRKFFTDDQWDIIDYALSEYQEKLLKYSYMAIILLQLIQLQTILHYLMAVGNLIQLSQDSMLYLMNLYQV